MKYTKSLMQTSYRVIWLTQHFVGSFPILKKWRKSLGESLGRQYAKENTQKLIPVPELSANDLEQFIVDYRSKSIPVVFKGAAKNWEACKSWSPDYFSKEFPKEPVVLYDATVENRKAKNIGDTQVTTMDKFITQMQNGSSDYARFLPILDDHPELLNGFDFNWVKEAVNKKEANRKTQLFIGGDQTSTSIHSALGSNLFVQLYGRKKWYIYDTKYTPLLSPIVDRSIFFRSKSNAEKPSGEFAHAQGWEVTLEPGDILYNPPFFWHQTRNFGITIGVGIRWFSIPNMLKSSLSHLILTLTASNPSILGAKKLKGNFNKVYEQVLGKN